jgi:hypothetical protein
VRKLRPGPVDPDIYLLAWDGKKADLLRYFPGISMILTDPRHPGMLSKL